jgi:hypothetical protein
MSGLFHSHTSSPACPGSENLLAGHGHRYLRLLFTAYWPDSSPSSIDIYYTRKRVYLSYKGIQQLQQDVLYLIQTNITDKQCIDVVFQDYLVVELEEDDVEQLGWRVCDGEDSFSL